MEKLLKLGKKKVSLDELRQHYGIIDYAELADLIKRLTEEGKISPVKASKNNGKRPPLYLVYHIVTKKVDNAGYREELMFQLSPMLDPAYYLRNLDKYGGDREKVLQLNQYILDNPERLLEEISINERSFDIWGREKYLKEEGGRTLLGKLGLPMEKLGIYRTIEPLAYYSHKKESPQNIVLIENKDTFYSMRRALLHGQDDIMGLTIGTLIYGAGKGILRSMQEFEICVEPYICNTQNSLWYFGDLDYEGILIYEKLAELLQEKYSLRVWNTAYQTMLIKAASMASIGEGKKSLPKTKKGQNQGIGTRFLSEFKEEDRVCIKGILGRGIYIPQEILNTYDFQKIENTGWRDR